MFLNLPLMADRMESIMGNVQTQSVHDVHAFCPRSFTFGPTVRSLSARLHLKVSDLQDVPELAAHGGSNGIHHGQRAEAISFEGRCLVPEILHIRSDSDVSQWAPSSQGF